MKQDTSVQKFEALEIGQTSPLKTAVWRARTALRNTAGRDVLDVDSSDKPRARRVRHVYRQIDEYMASFFPKLVKTTPKSMALRRVRDMIDELGYTVVDVDETKPWGGFYRLDNEEAPRFIREFFPGLSLKEAKLGNDAAELSPKFLLVAPGCRLSWQYHYRRAERWRFLTNGSYHRSEDDEQGERVDAPKGTVVQFASGERHRLGAFDSQNYTLVAEIWQHTDPKKASDESDIVRLADDFQR
jgi:mannose-6-phosphate isomerase